jgi:hypothetical protein
MGVLSNNRSQITSGGLISASFVSDLYDVLTGNVEETVSISGSLDVTGSIYGNLIGTASYVVEYVESSSFATSSSFAETASYVQTAQTASYVLNAVSSSYVLNSVSSSYATSSSFSNTASYALNVVSSSYASTASFVQLAQTASYVLNSVSASYALSSSFAETASYASNINLTPVTDLSSSIAAEFDGLAEADEQTVELDTGTNTLRIKETVAAPASTTRNFLGNVGVELTLSVSGSVFINPDSLPTSDPVEIGQLWMSGSFLMISTGSGI